MDGNARRRPPSAIGERAPVGPGAPPAGVGPVGVEGRADGLEARGSIGGTAAGAVGGDVLHRAARDGRAAGAVGLGRAVLGGCGPGGGLAGARADRCDGGGRPGDGRGRAASAAWRRSASGLPLVGAAGPVDGAMTARAHVKHPQHRRRGPDGCPMGEPVVGPSRGVFAGWGLAGRGPARAFAGRRLPVVPPLSRARFPLVPQLRVRRGSAVPAEADEDRDGPSSECGRDRCRSVRARLDHRQPPCSGGEVAEDRGFRSGSAPPRVRCRAWCVEGLDGTRSGRALSPARNLDHPPRSEAVAGRIVSAHIPLGRARP